MCSTCPRKTALAQSLATGAATSTCCERPPNFPPAPSTVWSTASPAAGAEEYRAVQQGACYCDWARTNLNCASCAYCRAGPRPAGYPFSPLDNVSNKRQLPQPDRMSQIEATEGNVGDCMAYQQQCQFGPSDWIAPTGGRSVMIAPNVWTMLPNQVPPAVAINQYYNYKYVDDIYDNRRGKIFSGCKPGRAGQCACN